MKRRFGLSLMVFAAGAVMCGWAQDEAPSSAPAQGPGPTPEYTQISPIKSLNFLGEALAQSTLDLGMSVHAAYDTNIATFSTGSQPQTSYLIGPHIGISQYRSKLVMRFGYDGAFGVYQQLPNSDSYSQSASGDILYQVTSRWQAHASDHFTYSANPFGPYYTIVGQPSPNNPNPVTYVPFANTNQNTVQLDLADQLNQYDSLTFTGSQSYRRYGNYSTTYTFQTGLYNLISYSGGVNYSHRFSARLSLGAGYNWTSLDFAHGQQRSGISAIQIFVNYQLSKSFSISGWAGPEYITAKTTLVFFNQYAILYQNDWEPAFGLNLGWQGLRDSFTAGLSRQVSDGGGLLATTTVYNVNGGYHRRLAARWDGTLGVSYADNASFAASNLNRQLFPDRKYTILVASFQLNRRITPQLVASASYNYIRETQKNIYVVGSAPTYDDNRVAILLQYTWNHPLGR